MDCEIVWRQSQVAHYECVFGRLWEILRWDVSERGRWAFLVINDLGEGYGMSEQDVPDGWFDYDQRQIARVALADAREKLRRARSDEYKDGPDNVDWIDTWRSSQSAKSRPPGE